MRELIFKKQFTKDVERIKRTGRDLRGLREVIICLAEKVPLPTSHRDHQLVGNFKDYRECHLGGDWLLVYQIKENSVIFVRAGSHSELLE
jgi:mRNA interferase YafQ